MTAAVHVRCALCIGCMRLGRVRAGRLRQRIESTAGDRACPRRRTNQKCAAGLVMLFHADCLPASLILLIAQTLGSQHQHAPLQSERQAMGKLR
ncbi:MAG TPA: hypothetical protein VH934_01920 [Xanthobacteraceae bacterium]